MAVAVGAECYIVPLTNIMESLRPKPESIHPVTGQGDVLAIRGEYVPLVYLHRRFAVPDAVTDPCKGIVVIVESEGANRIGLVVDDLLGQQQVVVKSLEANYGAGRRHRRRHRAGRWTGGADPRCQPPARVVRVFARPARTARRRHSAELH